MNIKDHNKMLVDRIKGVAAQPSDADQSGNPNLVHDSGEKPDSAIDHRSTEGRPTPGPWEYLQDAFRPVYRVRNLGTPRLVVCQVTTGADASLIVRAVNAHDDMLAALIAASHALKSYVNHNGSPVLAAEVAAVADAVIAKAEGRS